ncbi:MAG: hypothetical protein ACM3SV_09945 [Betaproteobacteria bacterium]
MTFFQSLAGWFRPAPPPSPQVQKALERVATLIDPLMRSAPGFEKKLAKPLAQALEYCDGLVAGLPGPIDIDRQSFASDPMVHAFFATADDIARTLGENRAVREYLTSGDSWDSEFLFAMLGARRQMKKTLGMAMEGGMVRSDVPVEYLYFSDHTVTAPGATLEASREGLRQAGLDSLLKSFRWHLNALRNERQALRDDRDLERDRINVLRSSPADAELVAHTRRLDELDNRLRKIADLLQPEQLVDALADFLATPATALRLEPLSVKVDRSGIVTNDDGIGVESLEFCQIIGRDRRRQVAFLARMRREDAVQAVEEAKELRQRYLMI